MPSREVWKGISYSDLQNTNNLSRSLLGFTQDIFQIFIYNCYNLNICFQDGLGHLRELGGQGSGQRCVLTVPSAPGPARTPWRSFCRTHRFHWCGSWEEILLEVMWDQSQPLSLFPYWLTQVLPFFQLDYSVHWRGGHWALISKQSWGSDLKGCVPHASLMCLLNLQLNCAFLNCHNTNSTEIPTSASSRLGCIIMIFFSFKKCKIQKPRK